MTTLRPDAATKRNIDANSARAAVNQNGGQLPLISIAELRYEPKMATVSFTSVLYVL